MSMPYPDPRTTFQALYPEVDPATPLPLSIGERIGISVSAAVLAFGGASGDLLVTGTGLGLLLLALVGASRKTARRIRNEARDRFPTLDWAENDAADALKLGLALPLVWVTIAAVCGLLLWLVPADYRLAGAAGAALIAALLTWFAPGLSPRWRVVEPEQPEDDPQPVQFFSSDALPDR